MRLLYVHIYSMQCRLEEGEGCSVVKEVLFTNNLLVRFSESLFRCSLLNLTKPPFCDVIILVLEILVSSKEYALLYNGICLRLMLTAQDRNLRSGFTLYLSPLGVNQSQRS